MGSAVGGTSKPMERKKKLGDKQSDDMAVVFGALKQYFAKQDTAKKNLQVRCDLRLRPVTDPPRAHTLWGIACSYQYQML